MTINARGPERPSIPRDQRSHEEALAERSVLEVLAPFDPRIAGKPRLASTCQAATLTCSVSRRTRPYEGGDSELTGRLFLPVSLLWLAVVRPGAILPVPNWRILLPNVRVQRLEHYPTT
jgi:hypothetical protein